MRYARCGGERTESAECVVDGVNKASVMWVNAAGAMGRDEIGWRGVQTEGEQTRLFVVLGDVFWGEKESETSRGRGWSEWAMERLAAMLLALVNTDPLRWIWTP
jgi:hypothetical protein